MINSPTILMWNMQPNAQKQILINLKWSKERNKLINSNK